MASLLILSPEQQVALLPHRRDSPTVPASRYRPTIGPQSAMNRPTDRDLKENLLKLRDEHRMLDAEISALETTAELNQLQIKRLKKRKLLLKDQISAVEDKLTPDIIA